MELGFISISSHLFLSFMDELVINTEVYDACLLVVDAKKVIIFEVENWGQTLESCLEPIRGKQNI